MIFLSLDEVHSLHDRLIERYGGLSGLRDEGALQSALLAAENRHWYESLDELPVLAATYAYHLVKAHAFSDGNKRVAAATAFAFVYANGGEVGASEDEIVETFLEMAAGELSRQEVEEIFRRWVRTGDSLGEV